MQTACLIADTWLVLQIVRYLVTLKPGTQRRFQFGKPFEIKVVSLPFT